MSQTYPDQTVSVSEITEKQQTTKDTRANTNILRYGIVLVWIMSLSVPTWLNKFKGQPPIKQINLCCFFEIDPHLHYWFWRLVFFTRLQEYYRILIKAPKSFLNPWVQYHRALVILDMTTDNDLSCFHPHHPLYWTWSAHPPISHSPFRLRVHT